MTKSTLQEENKAVYRRFIQELFNEGQLDKLNELVSPNYVLKNAPPGTPAGSDAIKSIVAMFRSGFPDLKITLENLIGEGDLLAANSVFEGTHQGSIFGIEPTGRKVTMPGLTMVRIVDGRLCESWVRNDMVALMSQLETPNR